MEQMVFAEAGSRKGVAWHPNVNVVDHSAGAWWWSRIKLHSTKKDFLWSRPQTARVQLFHHSQDFIQAPAKDKGLRQAPATCKLAARLPVVSLVCATVKGL